MKALAGVALIGAAAALATNPALMPLGMISGRRKRSLSEPKGDEPNRPLKFLDHFISQVIQFTSCQKLSYINSIAFLMTEFNLSYNFLFSFTAEVTKRGTGLLSDSHLCSQTDLRSSARLYRGLETN